MSRTENVELAVVCLLEDGGRVLLQNRKKEDWHGWALPGGHVEPGESFVDAVIREMQEETGLTIRHPRLVDVKQFPIEAGRYVVLLFKAVEWSGTLTSSEEGEMAWIEYSKLPSLQTVDDLEEMLHMMNTPELTEFQYLLRGDESHKGMVHRLSDRPHDAGGAEAAGRDRPGVLRRADARGAAGWTAAALFLP